MSTPTIGIIGAGAAGTSAAKTLHTSGADVEVELFTRTGEQPYNRMLVNKGVAIGLLEPEQAVLPATGAQTANTPPGAYSTCTSHSTPRTWDAPPTPSAPMQTASSSSSTTAPEQKAT